MRRVRPQRRRRPIDHREANGIAITAGFSESTSASGITSKGTPILSARLHACPMWCIGPTVQLLGARVRYAGASTQRSRKRITASTSCMPCSRRWVADHHRRPSPPSPVIYSDDWPRSAMPPLGLAERVERRLEARTVRQRPQQPKRFAHVRADPISVLREAHVDDASPSIDIHAQVGWTHAQELTSQPLAPVRCAPHPSVPKLACTRTLFCRNCHHETFQFEVGGMPRGAEHRSSRVPRPDTSAAAPHRLADLLRTEARTR